MNRPPAFQFYPSDFLSDENVMLMSNQAVGCYIKLLCINWKQGSVPSDIETLALLCGEDGSTMARLWLSLKPCFKANENGRLINPRLEQERQKQINFRKERSKSGKKGAVKLWKQKEKEGKWLSHSSAIVDVNGLAIALQSSSSSSSSSLELELDKEPFVESSDELRLSKLLSSLILKNNPKAKKPNFQTWAKHVDLLIRVDNRTVNEIEEVIRWCQQDDFWRSNILSTKKLREKFDQLWVKMSLKPESKHTKALRGSHANIKKWLEKNEPNGTSGPDDPARKLIPGG